MLPNYGVLLGPLWPLHSGLLGTKKEKIKDSRKERCLGGSSPLLASTVPMQVLESRWPSKCWEHTCKVRKRKERNTKAHNFNMRLLKCKSQDFHAFFFLGISSFRWHKCFFSSSSFLLSFLLAPLRFMPSMALALIERLCSGFFGSFLFNSVVLILSYLRSLLHRNTTYDVRLQQFSSCSAGTS